MDEAKARLVARKYMAAHPPTGAAIASFDWIFDHVCRMFSGDATQRVPAGGDREIFIEADVQAHTIIPPQGNLRATTARESTATLHALVRVPFTVRAPWLPGAVEMRTYHDFEVPVVVGGRYAPLERAGGPCGDPGGYLVITGRKYVCCTNVVPASGWPTVIRRKDNWSCELRCAETDFENSNTNRRIFSVALNFRQTSGVYVHLHGMPPACGIALVVFLRAICDEPIDIDAELCRGLAGAELAAFQDQLYWVHSNDAPEIDEQRAARLHLFDLYYAHDAAQRIKTPEAKLAELQTKVLDTTFLPHIASPAMRVQQVLHMARMLLLVKAKVTELDSRDNMAMQRGVPPGLSLMRQLSDTWRGWRGRVASYVVGKVAETPPARVLQLVEEAMRNTPFLSVLETGLRNGTLQVFHKGRGGEKHRQFTDEFKWGNPIALSSAVQQIVYVSNGDGYGTLSDDQAFNTSRAGRVCPLERHDDSERYARNLRPTIAMCLSPDTIDGPIRAPPLTLPSELLLDAPVPGEHCTTVLIDGAPVGWTRDPRLIFMFVVQQRRAGELPWHYSVAYDTYRVRINTRGGRFMIASMPIDEMTRRPYMDSFSIAELEAMSIADMVQRGLIEYIDGEEEHHYIIEPVHPDPDVDYTHRPIHHSFALGWNGALEDFVSSTYGSRATYGAKMRKQTLALPVFSFKRNMRELAMMLVYAHHPLSRTLAYEAEMARPGGITSAGNGQNIVVGIFNTSSNANDCSTTKLESAVYGFGTALISSPEMLRIEDGEALDRSHVDFALPGLYDANGIIRTGAIVQPGDVLAAKRVRNERPYRLVTRYGGRVTQTLKYEDRAARATVVTVTTLHCVTNREGMKTNAASQKTLTGARLPEAMLPFSRSGMTPTLVLASLSMRRGTINLMLMGYVGKAAAISGYAFDSTPLQPNEAVLDAARRVLAGAGFNETGTERMYDPTTGECIGDMTLFLVSMHTLHHMAWRKIRFRDMGKTSSDRQPLGGMRDAQACSVAWGEMDSHCAIVNNCTREVFVERQFVASDLTVASICVPCGYMFTRPRDPPRDMTLMCERCHSTETRKVNIPFSLLSFAHYAISFGALMLGESGTPLRDPSVVARLHGDGAPDGLAARRSEEEVEPDEEEREEAEEEEEDEAPPEAENDDDYTLSSEEEEIEANADGSEALDESVMGEEENGSVGSNDNDDDYTLSDEEGGN